jgi:hypothetical protein
VTALAARRISAPAAAAESSQIASTNNAMIEEATLAVPSHLPASAASALERHRAHTSFGVNRCTSLKPRLKINTSSANPMTGMKLGMNWIGLKT